MFRLDQDTDPELRNQVLLYHMSDVLTDRERARMLGLPDGCRIRERAKILAPEKLSCGKYLWIGEGALLDAQGGLTIGDYTQIGINVMVLSHTSHRQALAGETGVSREKITYQPTKIGSNCFIGPNSVIAPGVTIGDSVVVSPLTFVDRSLPDGAVIGGNRSVRHLASRIGALERTVARMLELLCSIESLPSDELERILAELGSAGSK